MSGSRPGRPGHHPERSPVRAPARLIGWLALVVVLILQVYGLYAPSVPGPEGPPGLDKVGHLLSFAVPAGLAWLLGARWVVVALVAHALVSEPLQSRVSPSRMLDPVDAVANLVGIALGVLGVARWRARR